MDVKIGSLGSVPFVWWTPEIRLAKAKGSALAVDTETVLIAGPEDTPAMVLGVATDGIRGVWFRPEDVPAFYAAHAGCLWTFHTASFDLGVMSKVWSGLPVIEMVDSRRVADVGILGRLLKLAVEGVSHGASLADLSSSYLGYEMQKTGKDGSGDDVRTSFGQFHGKPVSDIPDEYLRYAAIDAVATRSLLPRLLTAVRKIRDAAGKHHGYSGEQWLAAAWKEHGFLTHDIQLKASIACRSMSVTGIGVDMERQAEKIAALEAIMRREGDTLRAAGIPIVGDIDDATPKKRAKRRRKVAANTSQGDLFSDPALEAEPQISASAAMQKHLAGLEVRLREDDPHFRFPRTATGLLSTRREDFVDFMGVDPVLAAYVAYKQAEKLANTYAAKLDAPRIHPGWRYLLRTGRTSCQGALALQCLPRESQVAAGEVTVRQCMVAAPGKVLVLSDFSQIELVALAKAWRDQLAYGGTLADSINEGKDIHRLIAGQVLGKDPADVTDAERQSAKAVSFGRPGGMGAATLQRVAKNNYGVALSLEDVEKRLLAYEELFPEMTQHLHSDVDGNRMLAEWLGMSKAGLDEATGRKPRATVADEDDGLGMLGGMLLKSLANPSPVSGSGNPYSQATLEYLWNAAQPLADWFDATGKPALAQRIRDYEAGDDLSKAVRRIHGNIAVWTMTGRLRAGCNFTACRNTLFQGAAADGALLAIWRLLREGFSVVAFIHDEVVCEIPHDENLPDRVATMEKIMREEMGRIVGGVNVDVKTVVSRSLSKADKVDMPRCK